MHPPFLRAERAALALPLRSSQACRYASAPKHVVRHAPLRLLAYGCCWAEGPLGSCRLFSERWLRTMPMCFFMLAL